MSGFFHCKVTSSLPPHSCLYCILCKENTNPSYTQGGGGGEGIIKLHHLEGAVSTYIIWNSFVRRICLFSSFISLFNHLIFGLMYIYFMFCVIYTIVFFCVCCCFKLSFGLWEHFQGGSWVLLTCLILLFIYFYYFFICWS